MAGACAPVKYLAGPKSCVYSFSTPYTGKEVLWIIWGMWLWC